ncbi:DUF4062 domain-containing protein [Mesonia aquimarina]|uniref:DUF4062 domain-containing protein n=1 Tax=Mesonia aquimarina TaxID=1504967 RepID=UPI000EF5FCC8|nr:DUF4062 domain-containing protein [Mesonia aquimarina]
MRNKKFQIFVSSTYTDLINERQAAVEAILSSSNIPAGMELFSAGDESQMTVIKRWIDESDIFLLILGGRYGSLEKTTKKSYTELEYDYALELEKPLFSVVINEDIIEERVKKFGSDVIEITNAEKLKTFRKKVLQNMVKFWSDEKDIKLAIHETVAEFSHTKKLIGWVRGDQEVNSGALAEEIARLTKENSELREKANSQENVLYNGLSFEQLTELLKRHKTKIDGIELDLYQALRRISFAVNVNWFLGDDKKTADELVRFKLLKEVRTLKNPHQSFYSFTEDGHNYYLRTLIKPQKVTYELPLKK